MSDLVSVIIPVYNTAEYLAECLDSVTGQTYSNLEIIIVNDGSTDSSPALCESYAKKDPRIKIINQDNKGLSGARNTGLDVALGDYFLLVDSDDFIAPDMVESLHTALIVCNCDIAACGIVLFYPDGSTKAYQEATSLYATFEGTEKYDLFETSWATAVVQWNKLFKKEVFKNIRFPEGKIHEDEFVAHYQFAEAKRVCLVGKNLYFYRQRSDSIVANKTCKNLLHTLEAFADRLRFFDEQGITKPAGHAYRLFTYYSTPIEINKYCAKDEDIAREYMPYIRAIKRKVILRYGLKYRAYYFGNLRLMLQTNPTAQKAHDILKRIKRKLKRILKTE